MTQISGKVFSILFPLAIGAIVTATFVLSHKPVLYEVFLASLAVSCGYFIFVFICLYFNIGFKKSGSIHFSDVPGLTKKEGWFGRVASADISGSIDLASSADHPLAWIAAFLLSILLSIILPILVALLVFLVSGAIELVIFVASIVCYFSFYKVLRYQMTKRRTAKFKIIRSLGYSILFTSFTVGLVPIALGIYMEIVRK